MIESYYWREDIARFAKAFRPVKRPPRFSERRIVVFEKDVTIALFMVRRLMEAGRFSARMRDHRAQLFRCTFHGRTHRLRHRDIAELYDLDAETAVAKSVAFVTNQFIHADMTFAYREEDRNWGGLYTTSDFEKKKWLYRVPLSEIRAILDLAVTDWPKSVAFRFDPNSEDWILETE